MWNARLLAGFAAAGLASLAIGVGAPCAEVLYAETSVNGVTAGVVAFEKTAEVVSAAPGVLRDLGLVVPAGASGPIALSTLPGVRYRLDVSTQALAIDAEPGALIGQQVEAGRAPSPPDRPSWGALLNYSYYAVAGLHAKPQLSAFGEARVFGPLGIATTSFTAHSDDRTFGSHLRRLETSLLIDDVAGLRRTVVGDFISTSLPWTRAVRAGGFSFATDFDLQPNLITAPLPRIAGASATPTTVDLYVDNVKRFSTRTRAGPFAISELPVMDGRGQVSMVVTDALGRQTVQNFAFYSASNLLRPGLTAYALEGGFLREGFGDRSDRYTNGFVTGSMRRGLTDHLTVEATATAGSAVQTAGVGLVAKAGEEALFTAAVNASSAGGVQAYASVRRETRRYSVFASIEQASRGFRDLASSADAAVTARAIQAGASTTTDWGSLALTYNRIATYRADTLGGRPRRSEVELIGANWSRTFAGLNFYANAFLARGADESKVFTVGFSLPFRPYASAGATLTGGDGRLQGVASALQSPPAEGGFGWRATATFAGLRDGGSRLEGEMRRLASWGEVGMGASAGEGGRYVAARFYGSGAMVFMAGLRPRLAARVGDGFAVVDTGAPGVEITVENVPVGATGADGRLLVPQMNPLVPSRVALRPESVGLDREISAVSAEVRPARRAGTIVRLPVRRTSSFQAKLTTPDGAPVVAGAEVWVDGISRTRVGYDGLAYFSDLGDARRVEVATPEGRCFVEIPDAKASSRQRDVVPLVCRPEPDDRLRPRLQPDGVDQRTFAELQRRGVSPELWPLRPKLGLRP